MFSSFYEPLPDLNKALERIGLKDFSCKYDLECLDLLIRSFAAHVPYENLEVSIEHHLPSLESKGLFDKIVTRRRGGYCFEMNGFFWLLLRDLGFDAYSVSVYVLEDLDFMTDLGHRATIITIDGKKYFSDVGYGSGSTAAFAIPLDGSIRNGFFISYDETRREHTLYKVVDPEAERQHGTERFVEKRTSADGAVFCKKIVMFRDFIAYPQEFNLPNIGVFHSKGNRMIETPVCNFCNEKGEIYSIRNWTFTAKTAEGRTERPIQGEADLLDLAGKYFGIYL